MPTRADLVRCYQVLGLRPGVTLERVRRAYKEQVRQSHPDRFMHDESLRHAAEQRLKAINFAYKALSDFLRPRSPFQFELDDTTDSPSPEREPTADEASDERAESTVSRFRARTRAWWQTVHFSFANPEFFGPSIWAFLKTMSYGVIAWVVYFGFLSFLPELLTGLDGNVAFRAIVYVILIGAAARMGRD